MAKRKFTSWQAKLAFCCSNVRTNQDILLLETFNRNKECIPGGNDEEKLKNFVNTPHLSRSKIFRYPLNLAICNNNHEAVKFLLKSKADPELKGNDGISAVCESVLSGSFKGWFPEYKGDVTINFSNIESMKNRLSLLYSGNRPIDCVKKIFKDNQELLEGETPYVKLKNFVNMNF